MLDSLKRRFCIMISVVLIFTILGVPVYGVSEGEERSGTQQQYEKRADSWRFNDGYLVTEDVPDMFSTRAAHKAWSKTENGYVSSDGSIIKGAVRKGIDVSEWQGKINWDKVKADGIDFAIIRCGYGDDTDEKGKYTQDDSEWLRNVRECERIGMPYGVYLYSYADSDAHIKSEVKHVLRCLEEADAAPDYPIYLDVEDAVMIKAGKTKVANYAKYFCSRIEEAGYEAGIYSFVNLWDNLLYSIPSDPAFAEYDIWVAQFYHKCQYDLGEYRLWQCASDGTVSGIDGRVDINFEFQLARETMNIIRIQGDANGKERFVNSRGVPIVSQWIKYDGKLFYADADGYKATGLQKIGSSKYYIDKTKGLIKNQWVKVSGKKYYIKHDGTVTTGYTRIGKYYYLFNASGVMQTRSVIFKGKQYRILSSGISCIFTGQAKRTFYYRTGPSLGYNVKGKCKKGTSLSVIMTKNGWCQLSNECWVRAGYIKKTSIYPKKVQTIRR